MNKASKLFLMMAGAGLIVSCTSTQANDSTNRAERNRNQLTETTTTERTSDKAETVQEAQARGKTADQQSNSATDLELTRMIRQGIVADDSLSTNAHNVKIITENGKVTLKGMVNSTAEKAKVERIAKSAAKNVDNQLAITKQ